MLMRATCSKPYTNYFIINIYPNTILCNSQRKKSLLASLRINNHIEYYILLPIKCLQTETA